MKPVNIFTVFSYCAVFICVVSAHCKTWCKYGDYVVVGSRFIRPNSVYRASANLYNTTCPVTITFGIKNDTGYVAKKNVQIWSCAQVTVSLRIPNIPPARYYLAVESSGPMKFTDKKALFYVPKQSSFLLQTDKAVYKPDDLVRYRILAIDIDTKPLNPIGMEVVIKDGSGNQLSKVTGLVFQNGVFKGDFQISSQPVLGAWTISLLSSGSVVKSKSFDVDKYILPTFDVTIDTDPRITFDGDLKSVIRATYTYGKAVQGTGSVSVFNYGNLIAERRNIIVNGSADVIFNIASDLGLQFYFDTPVVLLAIVVEDMTGKSYNQTANVLIVREKYQFEIVGQSQIPQDRHVSFQIKVSDFVGNPLHNSPLLLDVTYYQYWPQYIRITIPSIPLSPNGLANVDFTLPIQTTYIYLETTFDGQTNYLTSLSLAPAPPQVPLFLTLLTTSPQIGEQIKVQVDSLTKLDTINFDIVARGRISLSRCVKIWGKKKYVLSFKAIGRLAPTAVLLVRYLKDGKIVAASLSINIGQQLQNSITVSAPAEVRPSANVSVSLATTQHSYVGLLAIDQSVLLLKSGNDLSFNDVFNELQGFVEPSVYNYDTAWYPDTPPSFEAASCVVLSSVIREVIRPTTIRPPFYTDYPWPMPGPVPEYSMPVPAPKPEPSPEGTTPAPPSSIPAPTVRQNFDEVWLWTDIEDSGNETMNSIDSVIPDSITSWVLTGFSLNKNKGLGLTKQPTKVNVFMPFFVTLNLPYSVKRGETLSIQVLVFNYMDEDVTADVTLDNSANEFTFINVIQLRLGEDTKRTKRVKVPSIQGVAVDFLVAPNILGLMKIKVVATTPVAGDAIEKLLPVEPEGLTRYGNDAVFINIATEGNETGTLHVNLPDNVVSNSTSISLSVIGDILGPILSNLESLIRVPYGCGEQNMITLVPNIIALVYLTVSGQLTPSVQSKAIANIQDGYQRELLYKRTDGSFSAFGQSDSSGSTWLTAFVVRSFIQAAPFVEVDGVVITNALQFLISVQTPDGHFPEVGNVIHKDMQGGSADGLALTAYVAIALIETHLSGYSSQIDNALTLVHNNINSINDPYTLAIVAYAFQLANHPAKSVALQLLNNKAIINSDYKYWNQPVPSSELSNPWLSEPRSIDIELTAYGLMAYLQAGQISGSIPIVRWLISQRSSSGGFSSTQDTVVGLTALAQFAELLGSGQTSLDIDCSPDVGADVELFVTDANKLTLQSVDLADSVTAVHFIASGSGFAVLQLSYQFNVDVNGAFPRFAVTLDISNSTNPEFLQFDVCSSFIPIGNDTESNMAVAEISLPSGYTADLESLPTEGVQKSETQNSDTVVVIYYNSLTEDPICSTIKAPRTTKVANQIPAPVVLYDFYDNSRRSSVFYQAPGSSLCDICEGDDCIGLDC